MFIVTERSNCNPLSPTYVGRVCWVNVKYVINMHDIITMRRFRLTW